jgi:thiamine transport system ATP-binding protein
LAVRGLTVRYGGLAAVQGADLDIAPGEVTAVLGPSGSGKSSLLRAIAGLEPLAGGSVAWDGVDLAAVPVHKRNFVMMFQDGQLFTHLTVAGNISYGLHRLPKAERRARTEELLELVDLAGYGRRPVTTLSGGQAQRVALARSLAPRPRLLLLDEPLSALDRGLREHLAEVLHRTLRAAGLPALYVTHDQDEAFALADRIGVMTAGRLLQTAPPAELWRHPADQTVAAFLGYGPFLTPATATVLSTPVGASASGTAGEGIGDIGTAGERIGNPGADSKAIGGTGTTGEASRPRKLVGLGPGALVPAADGVTVPVLTWRQSRGGVEAAIRLPDGAAARISLPEPPAASVKVRLDPAACVEVEARPDASPYGKAPSSEPA